jgi:RNA 2',3'-cyclic 3'-phosphodiesterase
MRLFLAITLPDEVRAGITRAGARARAQVPHVRWVREESLHLTLRFVGERPDADVPRLAEAVEHAMMGMGAFAATVHDAGAFPNFRRPRAVWLDMHPHESFVSIATRLDAVLAGLGIDAENRPFRPHVTLGRVREPLSPAEGEALERELGAMRERWALTIREVILMRSSPGPGGSIYTPLAAAPLGGGRRGDVRGTARVAAARGGDGG